MLMININHEIRSLLFEHDYVTIPGLGAFIAHYEPSVFNPENNSFSPPNRKISFNSVLKQDDGLLMSTVIKKRGVVTQRAKEIISNYVQNVKNTLVTSDSYEFSGIGDLHLSNDQKIVFSPVYSNFYNESYGFDTLYSFNNSNFTYSTKYFDETSAGKGGFEFDTMNISMSKLKTAKKTLYTKVLYALPLLALATGLISVLVFNPSTSENANSSLNPMDYIDSVKSWFSQPENLDEAKVDEFTEIYNVPQPVVELEKYKLVVGVFSQADNANKLYNRLVLSNLTPELIIKDNKNIIHINVSNNEEATAVSDKLEQLIGERGVLLKK